MMADTRLVLQQRLSQQLVMTPQLRQAIKILQVSRAELETLIDQELTENPVLEEQRRREGRGQPEVPTVDGQNGDRGVAGRRAEPQPEVAAGVEHRRDRLEGVRRELHATTSTARAAARRRTTTTSAGRRSRTSSSSGRCCPIT